MKLEIERGGAFTPSRSGEFGEQTGVENGSFFVFLEKYGFTAGEKSVMEYGGKPNWRRTKLEANQIGGATGGALEATLNEH